MRLFTNMSAEGQGEMGRVSETRREIHGEMMRQGCV